MKITLFVLTAFVAAEHIGILLLEMFFWNHPVGQKIFGMTSEISAASATLAANQGLYNGFLAAGIIWALIANKIDLKIFFLTCIVTAGIFGGLTGKTSIIFSQALPALIDLIGTLLFLRQAERS